MPSRRRAQLEAAQLALPELPLQPLQRSAAEGGQAQLGDVVVAATHGRTRLRLVLGSIAERVEPCPVLVT